MYDLNASTLRAFLRNKSKAEFLEQGELLARKHQELRHAGLTQRSPIGACFGVASRLLIPLGQKLCFWLIDLPAVGHFRFPAPPARYNPNRTS